MVISNYGRMNPDLKANRLLKHNVDTLLRLRHQSRKDLAQWCHKSESWISKIFREERREFAVSQLDRIADFFGLATYQLFQPGITKSAERRHRQDRRVGTDRRVGQTGRLIEILQPELNKVPRLAAPSRGGVSHGVVPSAAQVSALVHDFIRRFDRLNPPHPPETDHPGADRGTVAPERRRKPRDPAQSSSKKAAG